jgi:hypothetical protein
MSIVDDPGSFCTFVQQYQIASSVEILNSSSLSDPEVVLV